MKFRIQWLFLEYNVKKVKIAVLRMAYYAILRTKYENQI